MAFLTSDEVFDWSIQMGAGGSAPIEQQQQQQPQRQQQQQPKLICPRCDSSNTKFCYYNNYNRSQPRHFCRACRRHWTVGGTLRSVPVGGARKNNNNNNNNKNKRTTKTTAASNTTITTQPGAVPFNNVSGNMDESIDIYRQFTFYNASSDQGGSMITSFATNDQGIVINPLAPVSATSSLTGDTAAGILDLMPGGSSTSGTWIQDLTPLPTSYYNSTWWDDSTLHFVNSPGLEQYPPAAAAAAAAAAADDQLRPDMDV